MSGRTGRPGSRAILRRSDGPQRGQQHRQRRADGRPAVRGRSSAATSEWVHHLLPGALVDMVSSRSYVSTMPAADHEKLLNELRHLMRTHPSLAGAGEIALPYVHRRWRTRLPA